MAASVAWISIAPVKALGLVSLDEVHLTPAGVVENRRFCVVDGRGRFVNGRRIGRLVQVRPAYDPRAERLTLAFPDGRVAAGPADALGERVTTVFYGRPVRGRVVQGPFGEALSAFAGEELRLVRPEHPAAAVDRGRSGAVSMITVAALEEVATAAGEHSPLDGRRFRMLFGLDGAPPHAEDAWVGAQVALGEAVVTPRGHVGRCTITSQDPATGVRDLDTLAALRSYRSGVGSTEPLAFGVHAAVARPGRVRVGDPVTPPS
jgi:uncharacterized protein